MPTDPSIFKSYDVRGVFPETLNPEVAKTIGAATANYLHAQKIVVGRDMRESSVPLFDGLVKGILSQGCDVLDIGLCSTDMLYIAVGHTGADGGIMITASHNPGKDNGLKLCRKEAAPIGMGSGLEEIRDACLKNNFILSSKNGKVIPTSILPVYLQRCLSLIRAQHIKPITLVVDAGNGMGGLTWKEIQSHLPVKTIPLFFELDGTFPNHIPNPLIPENVVMLQEAVLKHRADMGIAFDGDADRAAFVDEKGVSVSGSEVTALISEYLLQNPSNKGKTILYDLRTSKVVPALIQKNGGTPLVTRVGHSHIKKIMKEKNALFAGELSGHYYFRENYNADSGMMAALILLQILSQRGGTLSELVAPLRENWHHSGEINFVVQDKEAKLNELKAKYTNGTIAELDGITIDFGDWWFNVRASNTEPYLRLNLEATTSKLLKEKKDELSLLLNK